MQALRVEMKKREAERMLISLGMTIMEGFGFVMLICGILGIKIF